MATRLFLSNITAPVSPTVNAGWNVTTGNAYFMVYPGKTTYSYLQAVGTLASAAIGAVAVRKAIIRTYISQPLLAQTIASASTISSQIKCAISSTSASTGQSFIYARKCNSDGTTLTEIGNGTSTDMGATLANRTITITLGSNITINDFDRIIIEIGWNYSVGTNTTRTGSIDSRLGPALGDLPVDNTTTTILNPWIEFSQTLNFMKGMQF